MSKIHLRGDHISYYDQQQNPYLQKYESFHGYCGYLQFKQKTGVTYTLDLNKVTCKRCLRAVVKNRENPKDPNC